MKIPVEDCQSSNSTATSRHWLFGSFIIAFIGALVLTFVQQILVQDYEQRSITTDFVLRFLLNIFSWGLVVLLFPKYLLAVWFFLVALYQTGIFFYYSYFHVPPSFAVLNNNSDEGMEVLGTIFDFFPWKTFCFFLLVAGLQFYVLRQRQRFSFPLLRRLLYAIVCLVIFAGLLVGLNKGSRRLTSPFVYPLEPKVAKFGLLPVCLHEAWFLQHHSIQTFLENARQQETQQSDLLHHEYHPPHEWKNIVILQVESLDYAVIRLKKEGKEVIPFINSLLDQSLNYRIWTQPSYGSATADFVMLNGCLPAKGLFNYNIPSYSFPLSLPAFLKEHGYQTFAVHGVRGSFYNRQQAFNAMRVDHFIFRQELVEALQKHPEKYEPLLDTLSIKQALKDQWLDDDILFAYSQKTLEENQKPNQRNFFLIITTSSHGPWYDNYNDIIPVERTSQDRYLNSIHVFDQRLRRFYESLPEGTLLFIYGDHTPHFISGNYVSDIVGGKHFVPLIISVKGENIHDHQSVTLHDQISLRDVYSYIKNTVQEQQKKEQPITTATDSKIDRQIK
ncbi:MAG: LTA synthase family protein [Planctomycetaceae bacterium]|nr:LTA synthase family protein [Planctomycetaceae bacterium]